MIKQIWHWLPRFVSLAFITFISLFSLDAVGGPGWVRGWLIHMIPSFILLILTSIAWKHERIGGILFLVAGVIMLGIFRSTIIVIPTLVLGILFLKSKKQLRFNKS